MAVCAAGGFPVRVHVYCTPKPAGCQPLPMGLSSLNFCKTCAPLGTGEGDGAAAPDPARDRSLPRPVGETGRRSVENRKECRLRHDYASFPVPLTPLRFARLQAAWLRPKAPPPAAVRLRFFLRFTRWERWGISFPKPLARGHRPQTPPSLRAVLSGLVAAESAAFVGYSTSLLFALRAWRTLGDFIPQTPSLGASSPDPSLASRGFKRLDC